MWIFGDVLYLNPIFGYSDILLDLLHRNFMQAKQIIFILQHLLNIFRTLIQYVSFIRNVSIVKMRTAILDHLLTIIIFLL